MADELQTSEDQSEKKLNKSYKCCKNKLISVVVCIYCGSVYHKSCSDRKNLCIIDETRINCCRSSNPETKCNITTQESSNENDDIESNIIEWLRNENKLLKNLLAEKDEKYAILLENKKLLDEKIVYLSDHKNLIPNKNNINSKHSKKAEITDHQIANNNTAINQNAHVQDEQNVNIQALQSTSSPMTYAAKVSSHISSQTINKAHKNQQIGRLPENQQIFQPALVKTAILQAQTANKIKEIHELGDIPHDDGWEKPKPRSSRRFVVGDNDELTGIQAVPKLVSLHVTRLKPETRPDDLKKSLENKFPGVLCEDHESKRPEIYKSMKVTIRQEHFKNAWKREVWPRGALVSRFLTKRGIAQLSGDPANPHLGKQRIVIQT